MTSSTSSFAELRPDLAEALTHTDIHIPSHFAAEQIRRETVWISVRDGTRLATDLYLPPLSTAPAIAVRSPYGRATPKLLDTFMALARRGYVVVSQDCRGTGQSEPDSWDYYVHEPDDGFDLVEWITHQSWYGGFIGALGSSYVGQTQWCMALHPAMSTIVPEVSGLGVASNTTHLYMFVNAYARSVGKGAGKIAVSYEELERQMLPETLAGGYFTEPLHRPFPQALLARFPSLREMQPAHAKRWLWEQYCAMTCAQRGDFIKQAFGTDIVTINEIEHLQTYVGHQISHDAHTLPHARPAELCKALKAPVLMITGWYDWCLNDALETWALLDSEAQADVRSRSRLIITPSAHNMPGYHEGAEDHPELRHNHRMANHVDLLLRWYAAIESGATVDWPRVIYYLMGANEWRAASAWPPPQAQEMSFYLAPGGALVDQPLTEACEPERYSYDPRDPTPTVGGSIVSYVYTPGSADVSAVQARRDVLTYSTLPLEQDLDVVGPLRLILFASSSALDTDFCARISDVFPDGRALQIQSASLRARYRNVSGEPELLEPGRVYRFEIDLWATANRFRAGHRLRLDVCSADFPKFDRNDNRGGTPGPPVIAEQTVHMGAEHSSMLLVYTVSAALDEDGGREFSVVGVLD